MKTVTRICCIVLALLFCSAVAMSEDNAAPHKAWSTTARHVEEGAVAGTESNTVTRPRATQPAALSGNNTPDIAVVSSTNAILTENSICIDRNNPSTILNANRSDSWPGLANHGVAGLVSTDGGSTWSSDISGLPYSYSDPTTAIDPNGRLLVGYSNAPASEIIALSYSDDFGSTWHYSKIKDITIFPGPAPFSDKDHLCVDNNPNSPYYGNVYSAFTYHDSDIYDPLDYAKIYIRRSQNGGETWSGDVIKFWTGAADELNHGVNLQTGPNGQVYAVWAVYYYWDPYNGSNEDAIAFTKSMDGGVTWSNVTLAISNIKGHRITPLGGGKTMRHNSFPSMAVDQTTGRIHVVWTNQGVPGINNGDPDIYLISSDDEGGSWSTPRRVNQDQLSNGKDQYFPWIASDPVTGTLACIFYDSRNFPSNDMVETYVAISQNGGLNWSDFCVSDIAWSGDGIPGFGDGYAGDHIGIDIYNGRVVPVWSDDRTGNMLAYVSPFCLQVDSDGDGIADDGDCSGSPDDNPCTGGATANCDDNCFDTYNPNQEDYNSNGIGDVCEGLTMRWVPWEVPTIQAAIDVAQNGNQILVAPGTYSGPGFVNVDFHGKNVIVRAGYPEDRPRIMCGYGEHAFLFKSGEGSGAKIIGLEIYDARVRENNPGPDGYNDDGGGAMILNSSPVIRDCLFYNCVADHGGGIAVAGSSSPQIINCTFDHCYASQVGAAIYAFTSGTVTFSRNIVSNTASGSAAHASTSSALGFNCCCFWNNAQNFSGSCLPDENTIFQDPLFCDGPNLDFYLAEISPCAPAHSLCGELVGTLPVNCLGYIPGDVNDDGNVNILDITYLTDYKFEGGPAPVVLDAGDVNADCIINVLDIIYLVNYKFKSGPALLPGCVIWGAPAGKMGYPAADASVTSHYDEALDRTVIKVASPVDLAALEIETLADNDAPATNLVNGLQMYAGHSGGVCRIGLLDVEGHAYLPAGTESVAELTGRVDVVSALGADIKGERVVFSTSSAGDLALPVEFSMTQNYPNPFNPMTSFSITLPEPSDVKIEVLNVLGQVVETLVDGRVEAGQHTVTWSAENHASGIYLYKLTAGEHTATRKMILMK